MSIGLYSIFCRDMQLSRLLQKLSIPLCILRNSEKREIDGKRGLFAVVGPIYQYYIAKNIGLYIFLLGRINFQNPPEFCI